MDAFSKLCGATTQSLLSANRQMKLHFARGVEVLTITPLKILNASSISPLMLGHKVIGKRDIESRLCSGEPDTNSNDGDNFHVAQPGERGPEDQRNLQYPISGYRQPTQQNTPNYISIILGIVCSLALLWPTQQEEQIESRFIPHYLYITNTIKLVFAYILGLITMVIFRP